MKEDLIVSAVTFLQDPNVANSPLAKKIEFLESKGLSEHEIEEALKRANGGASQTQSTQSTQSTQPNQQGQSQVSSYSPPIDYYNVAPAIPDRTWKDYFIMATATAGVSYGVYQILTKYLIPSIVPPTQSSIDKDKEKIDEEFIKIDKILEQLTTDQGQIKEQNVAKLEEIDTVIENINDFLSKYNKDKLKFDDDLRLMKLEIDNLNNSLEKNLAGTKENLADELAEIGVELQSLKLLVKSRGTVQNGASPEIRKIVPVSSIPSASEILKKAKKFDDTKRGETDRHESFKEKTPPKDVLQTKEAPKETPKEAPKEIKETPKETSVQDKKVGSSPTLSSFTPVFGQTSDPTSYGGIVSGGIPAWQIQDQLREQEEELAAIKAASNPTQDEKVKTAIEKVGVPSWQLNSATADKSEKKPDAGIPSWQLNSSSA